MPHVALFLDEETRIKLFRHCDAGLDVENSKVNSPGLFNNVTVQGRGEIRKQKTIIKYNGISKKI